MMASAPKVKSVPAVERAFSMLEMLATSHRGLTSSEIARNLNLPRSSVHYVLLTLERCGYLHRGDERGRYVFTPKLFGLANSTLERLRIRDVARPMLRALCDETSLTVHMAIIDQNEAVIIDKVEPRDHHLATWIGKRMPLHCTGTGKALLAFLPQAVTDRVVSCGLIRYNDNTIVSPRKFRDELTKVHADGYALDDEEETVGLRCIGAPVFDATGQPVAAVSVAGTIHQVTASNLKTVVAAVRRAAIRISEEICRAPRLAEAEADDES